MEESASTVLFNTGETEKVEKCRYASQASLTHITRNVQLLNIYVRMTSFTMCAALETGFDTHTHTHARSRAHARTNAHAHMRTGAHAHTRAHAHMCTCAHAHTRKPQVEDVSRAQTLIDVENLKWRRTADASCFPGASPVGACLEAHPGRFQETENLNIINKATGTSHQISS